MFNILVIEDNKNMRKLICATLKQNGYSTFEAEDGEVGLDVLDTTHIDLIICDIMMPNMDGYEFTETLRDGHCETPIIIVTAKEQLEDKKKGFSIGADDYMTKPFSMKQLLARVAAISRRFSNSNKPLAKVFKYDDLVVDCSKMEVFLNGKFISVTPIEWRILSSMIQNQRKVYTRDELLTIAFGTDYDGFDRSVDTHIKNLRKKLGDDPRKSTYIHTVHGIGYRFGGEV